MKKLLAMVLAAALLLFAVSAVAEEGDLLSRIQARGTLIVATEGNWSPWTYHDETTNELTGLDIEIATLIAHGLGVEPEFMETDWDAILAGVESGRFDIACNGVDYTEERAEKYTFTTPYVYMNTVLVVRADNEDILTLEDLNGKVTTNSPASTYADLAEAYGASVTYVNTLGETMALLEQGRADATLNARESVADYLAQHPDANIKVVGVVDSTVVAYPVRKDADTETLVAAINEILETAREDGTLAAISEKYFGVDVTKAE